MLENPAAFHLNSLNCLPIQTVFIAEMFFAKTWLVRAERGSEMPLEVEMTEWAGNAPLNSR